jgi:signal transduction histidine kinase
VSEIAMPEAGPDAVKVRLDALRVRRVFNNLFQNAFDAVATIPDGSVSVRVRMVGDTVETEVTDNGPGIAEEVLAHVFQPFVTFGKAHGTGLGLAICDRIVAEHGGRIAAENRVGGGASFRFWLPVAVQGDTDRLGR